LHVDVIIPALNEAQSVAAVVQAIPRPPVRNVYVVDNGSIDETAANARSAGATVIRESRRGYGSACLAGLKALPLDSEVVVFLDADGSDDLGDLQSLLQPIYAGIADLVVGSRTQGEPEPGALSFQQRTGNWIATKWLRERYGLAATDLGPFRAIRSSCLSQLGMSDLDYGWTVEMQIKAALKGLRYAEVPVRYRNRVGRSKISGTIRGALGAGLKITFLLARYELVRSGRLVCG
jgi:glycosyltransferase involved in cell wall biosynthesis